ncbi:hypothetical protein CPC08DRAFT_704792 [Agrocybe pediades]|nr:hypothetical protein CPC08DRAFT_704792 [Agrocybe pediades]
MDHPSAAKRSITITPYSSVSNASVDCHEDETISALSEPQPQLFHTPSTQFLASQTRSLLSFPASSEQMTASPGALEPVIPKIESHTQQIVPKALAASSPKRGNGSHLPKPLNFFMDGMLETIRTINKGTAEEEASQNEQSRHGIESGLSHESSTRPRIG